MHVSTQSEGLRVFGPGIGIGIGIGIGESSVEDEDNPNAVQDVIQVDLSDGNVQINLDNDKIRIGEE